MVAECQYILSTGNKCRAIALRGKPHCQHHAPGRRRLAPRKPVIRQTALLGAIPEIASRQDLHDVLSLTVHALANGSISVYRAQVLITTLQLMAKNL
jgi:hypothetical protein